MIKKNYQEEEEYDPVYNFKIYGEQHSSEKLFQILNNIELVDIGADIANTNVYLKNLKYYDGVKYLMNILPDSFYNDKEIGRLTYRLQLPKKCSAISGFRIPGVMAWQIESIKLYSENIINGASTTAPVAYEIFNFSKSIGPLYFSNSNPYNTEQIWENTNQYPLRDVTQQILSSTFHKITPWFITPWFYFAKNTKWIPSVANIRRIEFKLNNIEPADTLAKLMKVEILCADFCAQLTRQQEYFITPSNATLTLNNQGNLILNNKHK